MNLYTVAHLAIFSAKKNELPFALLEVLPRKNFPSALFFRDVPERNSRARAFHFRCNTCVGVKPSVNQMSLSSCQLIVENFSWCNRYRLGERKCYSRNGNHGHLGHFFM
ncbi:unnamed protein product [Rangifer tarandus platyrhynchus]|uniref:Uncharacterized protein n=1 Tax=Rangifer tarandus platyrhynchus TaxID=3082113 RepID=A0ABN8Z8R8_RANTA|nr:unnamed protein product [Rangifer tarandus platyrhynchus]